MPTSSSSIIIIGRGQLSSSLIKDLELICKHSDHPFFSTRILSCKTSEELARIEPKNIICLVHAGSGRLLSEAIHFCSTYSTPLIQASTGQETFSILPQKPSFIFLEAPNLSIPILKFMHLMEQAARLFKGYDVQIKESHQASKKTVPGTALIMAQALGKNLNDIQSIRDVKEQENLGIPKEHLAGHAVHWINFKGSGAELLFQTKIFGRTAYAFGLIQIIQALPALAFGYHHVLDLVKKELL